MKPSHLSKRLTASKQLRIEKEEDLVRRFILVLLLLTLLPLTACGFSENEADIPLEAPEPTAQIASPSDSSSEMVRIGFGGQEYERQIYEPLIKTFNEQNPTIQVQFISLDEIMQSAAGESFDAGKTMRQIVSTADTATSFFVRAEDIKNGLLRDLKPLMDADPNFNRDDFYPGALESASLDNGIYMLPSKLRISLLSYNKELWDARGLPSPKPDWTWQDMLAAAEQLAQKRGDTVEVYGYLDWGDGFTVLLGELAQAGINLFTTPADQLELDRPEVVAALERVVTLAKSGAIYARPKSEAAAISSDSLQKLITQQQAAMWQREMLFMGPDQEKPNFSIGTVPFPQMNLPFFGGAQGYIMSSGTQHPEAAWRWLSFLSQQDIKQPFGDADMINELPARKSSAERSGYWSKLDEETAAAIRATIERPSSAPASWSFDNRAFEAINTMLLKVINGEKTPEQALREAQSALQERLANTQTTPSPKPDSGPIVVATPIVETVPEGATKITFGTFEYDDAPIRKIAREFNQNNSGTFVEIKPIPYADKPLNLTDIAGTSDCFIWWEAPDEKEITATLDLQPLLDTDGVLKQNDYPAAVLARFKKNGGLYGLPYQLSFRTLTYNQDAFDQAGLSYPTAEWGMAEFLNAAQKLTSDSEKDKRYGYVSMGSESYDLTFFLRRQGISLTRGSGKEIEPNFTDPELVQAIQNQLNLLRDYSPHKQLSGYSRNSMSGGDSFQLIMDGRAGMWLSYGDFSHGMQGNFKQAIAPPLLGTHPLSPDDFNANGLLISAKTQNVQACWQWIKHLSADTSAMEGQFPARISVAEAEAFVEQAPAGAIEVYQAYRKAMERPATEQRESSFDNSFDYFWFFQAVDRALQGKSLEKELADAEELTKQFLACVRNNGKQSTCAKQVDPNYQGWNREENDSGG